MIELSRRVEPQDIIAALAGVAIPVARIQEQGKISPTELYRVIQVMDGLLALRSVVNVQQADASASIVADDLLEVATKVIHSARLMLVDSAASTVVDSLLDNYADAVEAAFVVVSGSNRALEPRLRMALRWTTL